MTNEQKAELVKLAVKVVRASKDTHNKQMAAVIRKRLILSSEDIRILCEIIVEEGGVLPDFG